MSNKKGFSGLDDLGTDIDDIISENHKVVKNNSEQKTASKDAKTSFDNNDTIDTEKSQSTSSTTSNALNVASNDSNKGSSSWIWWLIAAGAIGWGIIQSNSTSSSSSETSNLSSSEKNYSSDTQSSNYSETTSDDYYESKPGASLSELNKNQLLYCEAEKIRLDAVQNKIDLYSTYEVDKYNNLSNDYNSRCVDKQYYKNDMYYVDRNIDKRRYELQQEGLARFSKLNSPTSTSSNSSNSTQNYQKSESSQKLDLSNLSYEEKSSIKLACSIDKMDGPAKYNQCLKNQLKALSNSIRRPDLSNLSYEEKSSIELACSIDKMDGPAKYNQCLKNQLRQLGK